MPPPFIIFPDYTAGRIARYLSDIATQLTEAKRTNDTAEVARLTDLYRAELARLKPTQQAAAVKAHEKDKPSPTLLALADWQPWKGSRAIIVWALVAVVLYFVVQIWKR